MQKCYSSNSLFEAVKAKIKNRNCKILHHKVYCKHLTFIHFGWTDGKNEYEFVNMVDVPMFKMSFHKGCVVSHPTGYFDAMSWFIGNHKADLKSGKYFDDVPNESGRYDIDFGSAVW